MSTEDSTPQIPAAARRCFQCFKLNPQALRCTGCRHAYYCDRECQVGHWRIHRPFCSSVAIRPNLNFGIAWMNANRERVIRVALAFLQVDTLPSPSEPVRRLAEIRSRARAHAVSFTLVMVQVHPNLPDSDRVVVDTNGIGLYDRQKDPRNIAQPERDGQFVLQIMLKIHSFSDPKFSIYCQSFSMSLDLLAYFLTEPISSTPADMVKEVNTLVKQTALAGFLHTLQL